MNYEEPILDDDRVREILDFDPLAHAEKMTGSSYKDDKVTSGFGLLMHMEKGRIVEEALKNGGDTHFATTAAECVEIVKQEDFEIVGQVDFVDRRGSKDVPSPEVLYFFWHRRDAILGVMNTITWSGKEQKVNSFKIFFNWKSFSGSWLNGCSCHYTKDHVGIADKDVREGFRLSLRELRSSGKFINPWVEIPHLWLIHYGEEDKTGGYSPERWERYKAINRERLQALPQHVLNCMPAVNYEG